MPSAPTLRRPRRDARENRASILAAAASALAADPHASIDTIARAAGLSRRALYGHFDDRESLVRELIVVGAGRFNDIAVRLDDDSEPRHALARLVVALWNEASHVRAAAALALDDTHVAETARALAPLRARIEDILQRGQRSGALRTDIDTATLARLVEETGRVIVSRLDDAGPELAVKSVLGVAGLSWRESVELLRTVETEAS